MNKKIKSIILILSLAFTTNNAINIPTASADQTSSTSTPNIQVNDTTSLNESNSFYPKYTNGDFEYTIHNDDTIGLLKYTGSDANVTIPSSIDGKTVTSLDEPVFNTNQTLKSVTIPNTITTICEYAFEFCPNINSVEIPSSVTYLHWNSFIGCSGLESISISKDNPKYTSIDGVVYNKELTELQIVPGAIDKINIPNTVTRFVTDCFYGCHNLTNVIIPNSVTFIDMRCFNYCTNLKSVTVPSSVTAIGEGTFDSCNDSFIIYGEHNSYIEQYVNEYNSTIEALDPDVYHLYKLNFIAYSTTDSTATPNLLSTSTPVQDNSTNSSLTKTATNLGNIALAGGTLLIIASTVFFISKRKINN